MGLFSLVGLAAEVPPDTTQSEEIISLPDADVPLAYHQPGIYSWSILNLILVGASNVLAVLLLLDYFGRHTRRDKGRPTLRIVAFGLAVAAILLFVITEDTRMLLVLTNRWTVIYAINFVLVGAISGLAMRAGLQQEEASSKADEDE